MMAMFWVYFYTAGNALEHQPPSPVASVAWAATWGLLAALGLCSGVVPGLVLCVRPALFALITYGSGFRGVRDWPQLNGLALVWAGVGVVAVVVPPLAQVGQVARGLVPELNSMVAGVTLAAAFVPAFTLMLATFLMRPARRRESVAENGSPPRRG